MKVLRVIEPPGTAARARQTHCRLHHELDYGFD
jgi:hypothetical protein